MSDPLVKIKHPDENRVYAISFEEQLPAGVTLASATSIAQYFGSAVSTDLTLGSPSINNASIFDDDGNAIAANLAMLVEISGGLDGNDYRLLPIALGSDGKTYVGMSGDPPTLPVLQVRDGLP
jgi:hypothetical protein